MALLLHVKPPCRLRIRMMSAHFFTSSSSSPPYLHPGSFPRVPRSSNFFNTHKKKREHVCRTTIPFFTITCSNTKFRNLPLRQDATNTENGTHRDRKPGALRIKLKTQPYPLVPLSFPSSLTPFSSSSPSSSPSSSSSSAVSMD